MKRTINDPIQQYEVVEVCPECGAENIMTWDVEKDGYVAYCPHCGSKMMLCDECLHAADTKVCDWCACRGCYRERQNKKNNKKSKPTCDDIFEGKELYMKNKTNISALEELVNSEIEIYKKNNAEVDNDILQQNIWMTVESYYEDDKIPTKEELEYLEELELNFTEFAAHYEVITLDAPDGEICTVDSTCDPEEALKWYNEEINGFVYIQLVDHNSMLIEVLKCNF